MKKVLFASTVLLLAAACGERMPESEAARRVGELPGQAVDRATAGVNNAMQLGSDRIQADPSQAR